MNPSKLTVALIAVLFSITFDLFDFENDFDYVPKKSGVQANVYDSTKSVWKPATNEALLNKITALKQLYLSNCNSSITRLNYLLALLCTNSQTIQGNRASCTACFRGATSNPASMTLLSNVAACSAVYLNNTVYQNCNTIIQAAITGTQFNVNTNCPTGYCSFIQCVRRTNANNLINQCFNSSLPGNNITTRIGQINTYLSTTSCILAMTRCNANNPITGEPRILTHPYNALQITASGDLRIISFSANTASTTYFCSSQTTFQQSSYPNVTLC